MIRLNTSLNTQIMLPLNGEETYTWAQKCVACVENHVQKWDPNCADDARASPAQSVPLLIRSIQGQDDPKTIRNYRKQREHLLERGFS